MQNLPDCFQTVQIVTAVSTGNKLPDVTPQANLITDLGMNLKLDLPEIIYVLNQEYRSESLDLDADEVRAELEATEPTVLELARIVQEVIDLG
jgi:hypothetical protein